MQADKKGLMIKGLIALVGVVLLLVVFFTNFALVVFDNGHYQEQFAELNRVEATGMAEEELMRVTHIIQDYLMLQRNHIDIEAEIGGETERLFTEREIVHMEDVRELFKSGYSLLITAILILVAVLYLGASYIRFKSDTYTRLTALAYLLRWGSVVSIGIMLVIGAVFFIRFDFWYTQLHLLLFDNLYWLLNPEVHNLINIFPVEFFYNTLVRIVLRTAGYLAVIFVITLTFARFARNSTAKKSR